MLCSRRTLRKAQSHLGIATPEIGSNLACVGQLKDTGHSVLQLAVENSERLGGLTGTAFQQRQSLLHRWQQPLPLWWIC